MEASEPGLDIILEIASALGLVEGAEHGGFQSLGFFVERSGRVARVWGGRLRVVGLVCVEHVDRGGVTRMQRALGREWDALRLERAMLSQFDALLELVNELLLCAFEAAHFTNLLLFNYAAYLVVVEARHRDVLVLESVQPLAQRGAARLALLLASVLRLRRLAPRPPRARRELRLQRPRRSSLLLFHH